MPVILSQQYAGLVVIGRKVALDFDQTVEITRHFVPIKVWIVGLGVLGAAEQVRAVVGPQNHLGPGFVQLFGLVGPEFERMLPQSTVRVFGKEISETILEIGVEYDGEFLFGFGLFEIARRLCLFQAVAGFGASHLSFGVFHQVRQIVRLGAADVLLFEGLLFLGLCLFGLLFLLFRFLLVGLGLFFVATTGSRRQIGIRHVLVAAFRHADMYLADVVKHQVWYSERPGRWYHPKGRVVPVSYGGGNMNASCFRP